MFKEYRRLIAILLTSLLWIAGCTTAAPESSIPLTQATAAAPAEDAAPSQYQEAPEFAAQVAAGELSPVGERLPESPIVLTPPEAIGQYGGTWRTALLGGNDTAWLKRTIAYEQLVNWNEDFTDVVPNVAESYEISEDGMQITFHLRKGVKWSDGVPYTADDIMFFYEDLVLHDDLVVPLSSWWRVGGELAQIEKVDDHTVVFTFAAPNPLFVMALAHPDQWHMTHLPKHYLSQFHSKYNPDANTLAQEAGYEDWVAHITAKIDGNAIYADANWPVLWAWKLDNNYEGTTTVLTASRNPYYFKVDSEGNQLPYIDSVRFDIGSNVETLLLKAMNGEIDMISRHINTNDNKAVLFDNQDAGGYRLLDMISTSPGPGMIAVNMTHKDEAKRAIYQNKDFRIGLSHAINRQEIIDTVFVGQGEPYQPAMMPDSPYYSERFAKQYTEYDVDLANEHLDRAGLTERDAEGFRLGPDGERLQVNVGVSVVRPDWVSIMELVERYWEEVGIDTTVNVQDRSLLAERQANNEHDATIWFEEGGGGVEPVLVPRLLLPDNQNSGFFGPAWAYWRLDPENPLGMEPPDAVKKAIELYEEVRQSVDPAVRDQKMKELVEVAADNFYAIGITLNPVEYAVVSQSLHNVTNKMRSTFTWPSPAPAHPQLWYFE